MSVLLTKEKVGIEGSGAHRGRGCFQDCAVIETGFSRIELVSGAWKRGGLAEEAIPLCLLPPILLLNFSLRN